MKTLNYLKKIGFTVISFMGIFMLFPFSVFAAPNDNDMETVEGFVIIPEVEDISKIDEAVARIGSGGGEVNDRYNKEAEGLTTSESLASGIMNRDTIMNYLGYIIKFISQLGLVVGAAFIMYAGYKYMTSVFNGGKTPSSTLTNAIIGVTIVIFSYAIMRVLTSLIGLT